MNLTKSQIVFLVIVALIATYFLTGALTFVLNDAIKLLPKHWSLFFTIEALTNNYPNAYKALGLSALISFGVAFIVPFIPKKESLHGNAKFATSADINKMNLFEKKPKKKGEINKDETGIIIGKHNGRLLRFYGQQFVALGAPTRSGKGVGIVLPNLLEWGNSAVVQDIKQECFDYTSKFRQQELGQEVFLFNPFDRRTHRYNPLHYINMNGTNADGELTDFANILYPSVGDATNIFFNQLAQNLFIGLCWLCHDLLNTRKGITFLNYYKLECSFTLYGILQLSEGFKFTLTSGDETKEVNTFEDTYKVLVALGLIGEKAQGRIKSYFAIDSDNTRSGVMSSFNAPLMMFRADNMRLATSGNDFDFRDLRKKKMTIYVGITPDQLANAKQILNIFWQQLILVNTKELPQANAELIYRCLLLMDEFTAPGYLPIYSKGVSFIAGYWLRSLIIYQSNSQLETAQPNGYGREEAKTLLTNHACQIYYAMKDEDADRLSKSLRNKTVKTISRGTSSSQGGGSSSRNISETSRPLMLPQEIEEMPFEEEIIKIDGKLPIKCKKAIYFNDEYFMNRLKMVSPSLAKVKGIPTQKELESAIQAGEMRIEIPYQTDEILKVDQKEKIAETLDRLPYEEEYNSNAYVDDNEADFEEMIKNEEEAQQETEQEVQDDTNDTIKDDK